MATQSTLKSDEYRDDCRKIKAFSLSRCEIEPAAGQAHESSSSSVAQRPDFFRLTLKRQGDSLTGHYSSQALGEAELKGTL
jgi:hypothetical protein